MQEKIFDSIFTDNRRDPERHEMDFFVKVWQVVFLLLFSAKFCGELSYCDCYSFDAALNKFHGQGYILIVFSLSLLRLLRN